MAKNQSAPQTSAKPLSDTEAEQFKKLSEQLISPEDFEKVGGDLVGFWDPTLTPIVCRPLTVKLFDSNLEPDKPSILLTVELTKACGVRPAKDSDNQAPFAAPPGSLVGVWYKPGMRDIRDRCGTEVWMKLSGEKKIEGKPSPMKTFDITSKGKGTRIPVVEDFRDKSKPYRKQDGTMGKLTDFDVKKSPTQAESKPESSGFEGGF